MPLLTLAAVANTQRGIILDLCVILASVAVVAMVMQRMRLAVIPAYLITGALVGPRALGLVPSPEGLGAISHLAMVLLLFGIGLELHLSVLKHGLGRMILAGLASCGLSILVGWPIAIRYALSPPAALAVCMALSLSSTAVVLRIIADRRELGRPSGRLALSILVIQDMAVLAMLAALPALAKWAGTSGGRVVAEVSAPAAPMTWQQFALHAAIRVGGVIVLIVLGRLVLPRLLRESFRGRSLEVLMIVAVAAALVAAIVAQAVGFSLEVGAFLAGFVLAGTPFRHQLSGQIGPLRDLFIAVFFVTLGMKLDPSAVAHWWWVVLVGVAVMALLKATVIAGISWSVGASAGIALGVGLMLAQAGEFSIVLLDAAYRRLIISDTVMTITVAIVVLSLIATPGLVGLGRQLARVTSGIGPAPWIRSWVLREVPGDRGGPEKLFGHVIIAGYGPIGRLIAEKLEGAGIHHTVVELNPATVQEQSRRGKPIVFGDVGNREVLESAGIAHAEALVLTIPDEEAVLRASAIARNRAPGIFIAARTAAVSKRDAATEMGADHVTVDEIAAAEAMLKAVMSRMGINGGSSLVPDAEND